jgi:hypothetical protein
MRMWIETTETDRLHLHGQKRCLCFMPSWAFQFIVSRDSAPSLFFALDAKGRKISSNNHLQLIFPNQINLCNPRRCDRRTKMFTPSAFG